MPTTVEASNGVFYHLFQLNCLEPEITYQYSTITNNLPDGYRSGFLVGASAGLRTWKLAFPTLAAGSILVANMTGIKGETVSREQYMRSIYAENRVSGEPFVMEDTTGGESDYAFVDFADTTLSMQRLVIKLYSTGITLIERRLVGITI